VCTGGGEREHQGEGLVPGGGACASRVLIQLPDGGRGPREVLVGAHRVRREEGLRGPAVSEEPVEAEHGGGLGPAGGPQGGPPAHVSPHRRFRSLWSPGRAPCAGLQAVHRTPGIFTSSCVGLSLRAADFNLREAEQPELYIYYINILYIFYIYILKI